MGYYASYGGEIVPKKEEDLEKIVDIIKKYDVFEDVDYYDRGSIGGVKSIDISGNSKYYEDELIEMYKEISDMVESAEIDFTGEDDHHWRHECKDGKWQELTGELIYKDPQKLFETEKDQEHEEQEPER